MGYVANSIVRPPAFPDPGSDGDGKMLGELGRRVDGLDVVREIRTAVSPSSSSPSSSSSSAEGGEWIELSAEYESTNTLVSGSMKGFRGLGVQRAFWSQERKELVMVIWFGGSLSGWPGITHGGAIGTVFLEGMERAVGCLEGRNSGIISGKFDDYLAVSPPSLYTTSRTFFFLTLSCTRRLILILNQSLIATTTTTYTKRSFNLELNLPQTHNRKCLVHPPHALDRARTNTSNIDITG